MFHIDPDKYLAKLQELRQRHAWETLNSATTGGRPLGEAYSYAIGFQSGLDRAQKLVAEVLKEAETVFNER